MDQNNQWKQKADNKTSDWDINKESEDIDRARERRLGHGS